MKYFLTSVLLALLPSFVQGQSCSFSRSFGSGSALSTSGVEGFNAALGSTTTCTLTCDGGATTTLWLKYDETPSIFSQDGSSFDATGCSTTVSISSGSDEYRLGYTINSATYNNIVLTCSCSSIGPVDPGSPGFCFSESSAVSTRDRGAVAMKDLRVGEHVLVGHSSGKNQQPIYEPVYSFGHIHESDEATFLQLYTNLTALDTPLEISESHLIYKLHEGYARADTVKVYDTLLHGDGSAAQVIRIETVVKQGLYMPLTPGGSIVVNGLQASSYVSIQDWAPSVVKTLGEFGISEQRVFHWWLAPHRFFCMGISKKFCGGQRNEEGILDYLLQGKRLAELAEGHGVVVQVLVFGPPLLLFFTLSNLLEYPLGPSLAPVLLAVLGFLCYWKAIHPKKDEETK